MQENRRRNKPHLQLNKFRRLPHISARASRNRRAFLRRTWTKASSSSGPRKPWCPSSTDGQRHPLLHLRCSLSLLSARVSVRWKRVSGTMAARQRARPPPTRTLYRGHVGLVKEGTIALKGRERGCVPQPVSARQH